MIATSKRIRFTVDEYFRMSDAGVFDDKRVELIEGRIVRMHAQAHPHRWCVSKSDIALRRRFKPEQFWVLVQSTLLLGRFGAPEPDLHVFDVPQGTAEELLPKPFLVIEVSDKTYRRDSGIKLRMYAAAGIQDYWIVNLAQRRIEVHRRPGNGTAKRSGWRYDEVKHYTVGQKVKLLAFPKIAIAVSEIIP